jgi:hypothetical protein
MSSVGAGIFLIALGAILAFAVRRDLGWLDITIVGWVLMLTGVARLALALAIWSKRRSGGTVTQERTFENGHPASVSERRVYHEDAPPPSDS